MEDAGEVAAKIVETLRQQYQISYTSTNQQQNGEWRKLKVEITPKTGRKLTVVARQGYFAPGRVTEIEKIRSKKQEKNQKQPEKNQDQPNP